MQRLILHNATIVTGQRIGTGSVIIEGDRIRSVVYGDFVPEREAKVIELAGKLLMAGGVDAHVHFREPGLTWKGDIQSESRAALLGGVTSFIDMPNTVPPTTDIQTLEAKASLACGRSWANYGFHLGATGDNIAQLRRAAESAPESFAGIKVFMGSSNGGMKVEGNEALEKIFSICGKTVSIHAEDEAIVSRNLEWAHIRFGEAVPVFMHPQIRSRQACIDATAKALAIALKQGTMLHVLHVSTAEEVEMIAQAKLKAAAEEIDMIAEAKLKAAESGHDIQGREGGGDTGAAESPLSARITAETSINYLWFSDEDYPRLGGMIKCNPAIKSPSDRERLIRALRDGEIDTIGSDHAPHALPEKDGKDYDDILSGIPSIQFTLPVLLTIARREDISLQRIASAFSERPAELFGIRNRGRIEPGCFADLVIADPDEEWTVTVEDLEGKCGWSPYVGERLTGRVKMVIVNGSPTFISPDLTRGMTDLTEKKNEPAKGTTEPTEKMFDLTENISINEGTLVGSPKGRRIVFD